jgi:pimeloyl-ACP methyl ester carboxylesterase
MKRLTNTLIITFLLFAHMAFSQSAIHVESKGTGEPVLFLPGFATPGEVWNATISNLTMQGEFHLVSYAGFNGMRAIGTPWYDAIKEALIEYIVDHEIDDLTIIGHSMGGNLAIDLTTALPDRITGLVLVDAIPCMRELMMPGVPAESLQYESEYNNRLIGMSKEDFKNYAGSIAQNMTHAPEKIALITTWAMEADRETYVYGYTDLLKLDQRSYLTEITIPTLILGASFPEPGMVRKTFESQYANLSNKRIELAQNSKHFIMFDQPTWLYTQIDEYLSADGRKK